MFRGFAIPWLIFVVVWALIGAVHLHISGTNSTPVWSRLDDHAYWLREIALPALLVLAAWIAIGLVDRVLEARKRSSR
jgi:hypothetical protein